MRMKRLVSVAVIAVMAAASVLSGCGSDKEGKGSGDSISVSIFDRGKVSASEGTYQDNHWTKWINEQSGVNVDWVPIPRNESKQKFNALLAAGEAPDLIVDYDVTLLSSMVNQGVIAPVDEFVDQYSTVYKKYLEENPELKDYVTYDGKMFAVTSKRSTDSIINHGVWIRQDWLDKVGLAMPTTDEELLNVARAFRDKDPDGNGVNDTTAFAMMTWHSVFPAMYQADNLWYDEGGTLKHGHTLDRYGDAIGYVKTLYDENLIDKEFVTDKDNSRQKQLWATGKAGILVNQWTEEFNKELMQNNPSAKPVPMPPVSTRYGTNAYWQEAEPYLYVAFNKNIKNPEAAMKFLDWMLQEGWYNLKFGEENVHYKLVDGVPQKLDDKKFDTEVAYASEYGVLSQWDVKPEWIPIMAAQDETSQILAKQREESLKANSTVKFRRDIPVDPQLEQVVQMFSEFEVQRDDIRMKTIIGGPQYDKQWCMQQIRSEWKRLGGEESERLMNEWYRDNR